MKNKPFATISLTKAEYDTIIAALRFWQRTATCTNALPELDIAMESGTALNNPEIDALIEEIQ